MSLVIDVDLVVNLGTIFDSLSFIYVVLVGINLRFVYLHRFMLYLFPELNPCFYQIQNVAETGFEPVTSRL